MHIEEEFQIGEIKEDLLGLLGDIEIGTSRAAEIVRGLRNFSRMDSDKLTLTDLHETIDATLVILSNKLKEG